jgi:acetylornithine/succinyldiaminopimelate/putrescine aminotransferase
VGLAFDDDISGKVISQCNEQGLLLNPVRPNAVRFMPPLNVTAQDVDDAVARVEEALGKL